MLFFIPLKVYTQQLLEPLLQTIIALSGSRTTILVWGSTTMHLFLIVELENSLAFCFEFFLEVGL